jgi:hypothetical protein
VLPQALHLAFLPALCSGTEYTCPQLGHLNAIAISKYSLKIRRPPSHPANKDAGIPSLQQELKSTGAGRQARHSTETVRYFDPAIIRDIRRETSQKSLEFPASPLIPSDEK